MRLADVQCFRVTKEVVQKSEERIRQAGREGYELFILWSGVQEGDRFTVRTPHVPKQESFRIRGRELLVQVEGEALHQLNAWLYEAHEMLGIQVHSHPTEAFHSDTDDKFAMVTTLGGLSIVVPDFGSRGLITQGTAVYRLDPSGWIEANPAILQVVEVI